VYAGGVYAVAGGLIVALALASGTSLVEFTGQDAAAWLGLVLVPTLGGHTVLNWALRHVPASIVSVSVLGEPLVMIGLAWLVLGERPAATALVGGAVLLTGLYRALRAPTSRPAKAEVGAE
jgi:drug/metabolite transporter (DMT)-like permease